MKKLYGIRDRLAQELVGSAMYIVFAFRTDQQAVRYFADAVLDKTSILNKHPADYELIQVGTVTDDGALQGCPVEILMTGDRLIAAQPEPNADITGDSSA